jgi:hypothetical protein
MPLGLFANFFVVSDLRFMICENTNREIFSMQAKNYAHRKNLLAVAKIAGITGGVFNS